MNSTNPMRGIDLFLLILLATIWGGSFFFMRILAPVLDGCAMVVVATWLVVFKPVRKE